AILTGVPYYILPSTSRAGFSPDNLRKNTSQPSCPLDLITQLRFPRRIGVPVIFTPQNSSLKVVPLSHNLNIHTCSDLWFCPESKIWTVKSSSIHRGLVVTTGGTFRSLGSWFRIERHGDSYKLVHCPRGSTPCRDVGIETVGGGGRRYLAPRDRPLAVRFTRASG
uniref:Bark lectin isoform 1 n=1 Tax=Crateva tapia TaxID=202635 RepID=LECB1_CRATA|nr:RecName: Full=Bark lectin isoform 1; Short=CrataBL; Short=CrataBL-form I [Crateva tapia]